MTTTTVEVLSVRTPAMPRGARVAADLFVRAFSWLATPAAPRAPSRGEEAAAVRRLAYSLRNSDPGFSADLYAAASRHETQGE
ncbi:MAG: hypothetical protein WAQ05_15780 [Rubrivivax sp.]